MADQKVVKKEERLSEEEEEEKINTREKPRPPRPQFRDPPQQEYDQERAHFASSIF